MVPGRADLNFRLQGAVYLLADAWAAEAWDSDLERFHLINDTGCCPCRNYALWGAWCGLMSRLTETGPEMSNGE